MGMQVGAGQRMGGWNFPWSKLFSPFMDSLAENPFLGNLWPLVGEKMLMKEHIGNTETGWSMESVCGLYSPVPFLL